MVAEQSNFPRIDVALKVAYRRIDALAPGFKISERGLSFALKQGDRSIECGAFLQLELRFPALDVDVECQAVCVDIRSEGDSSLGVFQFVNTHPATVESIHSIALFHLLRLGRQVVVAGGAGRALA